MSKLVFGDPESISQRDKAREDEEKSSETLLETLTRLHHDLTTYPWQADIKANYGKNWGIADRFGESQIDGKQYILTTDGVHASELRGDAKTDAEGIAELRNLLPDLIRFVEAQREI